MKELTILMPCLNEAETLGACIQRAQKLLADNNIEDGMAKMHSGWIALLL
jgi:hypothetical protein